MSETYVDKKYDDIQSEIEENTAATKVFNHLMDKEVNNTNYGND